jgi:hypothetical protein
MNFNVKTTISKKLQYRQDLIDRQAKALEKSMQDEDKRIAVQVEQAQMKKDMEEQKKRDFQQRQRELIAESRAEQVRELERRREEERLEAKRLQRLWTEQKEDYVREELAKKMKSRTDAQDLQKFHRSQMVRLRFFIGTVVDNSLIIFPKLAGTPVKRS